MPYLPPTANATAVPRRLQALQREVNAAQAATSGQVNATVHELKQTLAALVATQAALPVPQAFHDEKSGEVAGTVLSRSVTVPAGKTKVAITASFTANYLLPYGSSSELRKLRVTIAGTTGPLGTWQAQSLDGEIYCCWWGGFGRQVSVTPGQSVTVALVADSGASGGAGRSPTATLDTLFIFS